MRILAIGEETAPGLEMCKKGGGMWGLHSRVRWRIFKMRNTNQCPSSSHLHQCTQVRVWLHLQWKTLRRKDAKINISPLWIIWD